MSLTWMGYLFIPLGFLMMIRSSRIVLAFAIFSAGFTASSFIDLPSGQPISAIHYFGLLFLISRAYYFICGLTDAGAKFRVDWTIFSFCLFILAAAISLFMPAIINGQLLVSTNQLVDLRQVPLTFRFSDILGLFPLVFGGLLVLGIYSYVRTEDMLLFLVKVYVCSGVFVAIWGLFQFACIHFLPIDYPSYIFNLSKVETARGFQQVLGDNSIQVQRISSVTHEPSVLVKYLHTIFPVLIGSIWFRVSLFGKYLDRLALFLIVLTISLSTSTTGIAGILIAIFYAILVMGRFQFRLKLIAGITFSIALIAMAFLLFVPNISGLIMLVVLSKLEGYSAVERILSVTNSWEYFLAYPILGVGWAVVTVNDLIVYLLVSTGVTGLFLFGFFSLRTIWAALSTLKAKLKDADLSIRSWVICISLLVSFLVTLTLGLFTGIEFYLGYFYILLGLFTASIRVLKGYSANQSFYKRIKVGEPI